MSSEYHGTQIARKQAYGAFRTIFLISDGKETILLQRFLVSSKINILSFLFNLGSCLVIRFVIQLPSSRK